MYTLEQNLKIFQLWYETTVSHSQKSAVGLTHTRVTNLSLSVQHLQLWKYIGLCSILK